MSIIPKGGKVSRAEQIDMDSKSVYVSNIGKETTSSELAAAFSPFGAIQRVTILLDRYTNQPRGFAYVEFERASSVQAALAMNDHDFKGKKIKVMPKRTNEPGITPRKPTPNQSHPNQQQLQMQQYRNAAAVQQQQQQQNSAAASLYQAALAQFQQMQYQQYQQMIMLASQNPSAYLQSAANQQQQQQQQQPTVVVIPTQQQQPIIPQENEEIDNKHADSRYHPYKRS